MIWSIFLQLALALGYMHLEKHVVHRDLHPSNVMIDDMRRVKISMWFNLSDLSYENSLAYALRCASITAAASVLIYFYFYS